MPIEIYKDPETGEERRRWVAPKGMATKPAAPTKAPAPTKPKDSGFDLGGAVNTLVKNTAQVLTNPAAAALPVMGLVKQAAESPATRGALESVGRTVMYGGRQFLQETNDFVNDELAKTGLTQRTTAKQPDAPFLGMAPLPKVETQHPAEAIIGNILGYGIGFAVTRKAMGAAGKAAAPAAMRTPLAPVVQQAQKVRGSVQALRNTPLPAAGQAGRTQALAQRATGFAIEEGATGAVAGAITTYAFQDPWSGNFSDLLKGTPLESPFSRFTQSNPNDKAEEARLKNAATDFVYGIPLGIGIGAAGAAVKAATAKVITKTAKLAATVDNVAVKEAEVGLAETVVATTPPPPPIRRITGRKRVEEPTLQTEPTLVPEAEGRVEPTMNPEVEQARKELEDAQFELQSEVAKETYSTPEPMPLAEGQLPELAPPSFDELATLPPSSIQVDPKRFQFKEAGQTKTGQSGSLTDTETYNPDLANVISVWRDPADGQVYVVNGHNRLARANRSDAPGINVRFIQAADAAEARTKGAMQNISEEKGTPVDAAKVMRDSGMGPAEMVQAGVSPSSRVMTDAVPLSRLPQNLFDKVATGKLEMSKAVALGSVEGLDEQVVNDVAAEAIKRKWSAAKIEQAMQEAKFAQTETQGGGLLDALGAEWATKTSNFNQLLDIRTEAFRSLREEMVALTSVAREGRRGILEAAGNVVDVAGSQAARGQATQAVEVFNRVTGYVGPVRDLLNEMAGQIKGKVTAKQVVTDNLERLRTAIQEEINGPRLPMEDAAAPVIRAADEVTAPVTEVAAPAPRELSPEDRRVLDNALKGLPAEKRAEVIARIESGEPIGNPTPIGDLSVELPGWTEIEGMPRLGEGFSGRTTLTPDQRADIEEIAARVAGMTPDQVRIVDSLPVEYAPQQAAAWGVEPGTRADVAGMLTNNGDSAADDLMFVAMSANGRPKTFTRMAEVSFHEAFHRLQWRYLTDQERRALQAGDKQIRELAARVSPFQAEKLLDGTISRKEAEAVAFQGWWKFGGDYEKATWAEPFKKLQQITEAVGNWLMGRGYQTWDDVFERAFQGEIAERGMRPELVEDGPEIQLAVQPPDPEDFARRIEQNIDAMRSGEMDMQEAMSSDVRRYVSRSGQTIYRPSAPEEMIATNKALHDMLASRADATGIASYNVEEIYQQAARRLAKDGLHVETTVKRLEAARAGDPRSQEDLISHAAVILHRDEVANQNGIAAIEFQNATDEASKADAMRRLWAGYEDQIKLDTALMTATRKDAQRLRLNQGPERKTFVNARELPEGSILRHGTNEEAGQAILTDGFRTSGPEVGILGDGVYFTTKDTYAGAYGDVEVYGDMPGDIRIFDLFAMDKSMAEFLQDLGLGRLDKDGLINQQQKDAIRQWVADNGYQGIRFEADFGSKPNKSGVDEVIIYDANNANRVVGSDAAVPPTPDLPDETVQEIVDKELQDPANSLLEKLDPEIRADIEDGVLGPDAEELTDTLARVAITSRDVKGFASKFGSMAKEVPTGKLTQDLILQMYRSSLLWSMKTWMKMALGSAYRSTTLPAAQAFGALADAARQGASGNAQGAANALRRAGLDMGMYLQYMARLPHAMRLAGHALKEGESFGNLGRSQMEVAQKGFSEADQMALDAPEFAQTGARENTLDNPYFLNPESKNMVALATRALWKVANLSGRVAGSLDTFYSSLVGPSAEWARLMDLQLRQADDLGMNPAKAWQWASDKTDELLDAQWAKVVLSGDKVVENGALTGKHAQTVMDWVNFTDPLDIKFQDRSLEYGIRKAKDEGLTDAIDINARALEWTKETPDAWQKAGMGAAKVVSLAPKLYQDAVNQVPILGMIQAFNRGPTNITKAAMRASGFASPLVDTFWRDINSEDAFTRDRAIGEIAVGWLTAVSAVTLATSGYVELTGPGSYNPQVRQKMKMDGYRPFAIRFRNPWTNEWSGYWDLTPYDSVATVFAGVATYMNAANNIPAENREALANNLVLTIAESIRQVGAGQFTKGMYGGISDIFEMLSDLESGNFIPVKNQIGSFDAYIQKKLTGFMPAVFRNVRRGQDPYERVIPAGDWPYPFSGLQELGARFMNEIPGLSEKLPPNLHPLTANPIPVEQVWGTNFIPPEQPWLRGLVQGASPTAGMPYTMGSTDPVDNELRRLSGRGTAFIIWNTNEFQIPNYRLSIEQLNRIKEITRDYVPPGRMTSLHGSLTTLVTSPEYMSLPTPEPSRATESARAIQVNQEINYYKQYIKNEFRAQDPEVDQMLQKIENTKTMNQNDAQMGVEAWTQRMTR